MPNAIDEYIAAFPPNVRRILKKVRASIRSAAPGASEGISYRIPTYKLNGRPLVYFAGFQEHIGFYPPVKGDPKLEKDVSPYANEKGNLRFPLDQRIPYALISRVVRFKVKQIKAKASSRKGRRPSQPKKSEGM